ncbi:hypothetical protein B0J14DRAFT_172849 [Halenospora varia]|nr:hypothetical protein B0J14DRAFT_172849 [Halenospora varia]
MLRDIPPEIVSSICEYLKRPDLRNVRLLHRVFDSAARRILFRTIFLKVNSLSFGRLLEISKNETLRHHVEVVVYDGRELDLSQIPEFKNWLCYDAARGIGLAILQKREDFLARFSRQQLQEYYFNFCRYVTLAQEQISQWGNEEEWLREATRRFPRLSAIEYAESELDPEYGRELQPMSLFSQMAQEILAEPDEGLGFCNAHFWALVRAVFCGQERPPQVKALRGEMLDYEYFPMLNQAVPQLNLRSVQRLSLDFVSEGQGTATQTLASFLKCAPNLSTLRLSFGDQPGLLHNPATFLPTGLFDQSLHWNHLRDLSLQNLVLSPSRLQQLLRGHSTTLRSLELSDMTLQLGSETIVGGDRALWIRIIEFLSQSLSLNRIKLVGYFMADTNEAWTTSAGAGYAFICAPQGRCLLSRIEHFIIHGGPCPFTLKRSVTPFDADLDLNYNNRPWIPEHSWTWEEDDSWRFAVRPKSRVPHA